MKQIKHHPLFDTEKVIAHYEEKDGVPITYVCTTDLRCSDMPADVFYRETPHPDYGNRYFGLFYNYMKEHLTITNADIVEEFEFGMVENDNGELEYSQSHHDYKKFDNGNMIDGGRAYVRGWGYTMYKVKDGEFIKDD
jgi:hypothetical protein